MAKTEPTETKSASESELPTPELLKPKTENSSLSPGTDSPESNAAAVKTIKHPRLGSYKPSHRATFIGLAVVGIILAINAGIVVFVVKSQSSNKSQTNTNQVTLSTSTLNKIGVNNTPVGDSGILLTIGPETKFGNNVQVAGDINIAGQLTLNNKITAFSASLTNLQAGNTSLSQLNVNGNTTLSNLNLRNNLIISGTTQLNGAVTVNQLFTVNNAINVAGNMSVGGTLSVGAIQTDNMIIGGHVATAGYAPSVSGGSCDGSNGTVSISGNDASGTVAVNIGVNSCAGLLASVRFRTTYSSTPVVVITPVGGGGLFYINRSASGFSIGDSQAPGPGGYAFDYIVE